MSRSLSKLQYVFVKLVNKIWVSVSHQNSKTSLIYIQIVLNGVGKCSEVIFLQPGLEQLKVFLFYEGEYSIHTFTLLVATKPLFEKKRGWTS